MKHILVLVFVVTPFIEIWLMILTGRIIGGGWVLFSLLAAGFIGMRLFRHEGMRTISAVQERLQRHEPLGNELLDGALRMLGALLLIIPGYLSDLGGLLLILPFTRNPLRRWLATHVVQAAPHPRPSRPSASEMIIEGEVIHPEKKPPAQLAD
ncbi:MAG: FxsA family protein [Magnetococcales bacterium]|nr:FxsA family protein [Magnetococcales bacterium]